MEMNLIDGDAMNLRFRLGEPGENLDARRFDLGRLSLLRLDQSGESAATSAAVPGAGR